MSMRIALWAPLAAILIAGAAFTLNRNEGAAAPIEPAQAVVDEDADRIFPTAEELKDVRLAGLLPDDVRSFLAVNHKLRYGEYLWNDRDIPDGKVEIRVDLRTQMISVYRAGHEIGTAVVLYGAQDKETPIGSFPIMAKMKDHRSATYDAPMPYTMRLTDDGVAVHGSDVRWGAATHGCIGVPLEFARLVFGEARVGDEVRIFRSAQAASPVA